MLKLGDQSISALRLGGTEIKKAYLGEAVVFDVSEPPVPTYTISASIDPAGTGTVSGAGTYPEGETVTITASPGDGYQFTEWRENGVSVSKNTTYSFVAAGDRVLVAAFSVASGLPSGYTEVEYIQNGDTSSVLYKPFLEIPKTTGSTKFEIIFAYGGIGANGRNAICGWENSVSTVNNRTIGVYQNSTSDIKAYMQIGPDTSSARKQIGKAEKNVPITAIADSVAKVFSAAGASISFSMGTWFASKMTLFGYYNVKAASTTNTSLHMAKIYTAKWYNENGELLRELVPCIAPNGTVGMYDTIEKIFYKSANSNSSAKPLIAGPAV